MSKFLAHLPVNGVSFGQTSVLILRTILDNPEYANELLGLFLVGNDAELNSQDQSAAKTLIPKIKELLESGVKNYDRSLPIFKLWHLNGSLESYSSNPALMSFYELDEPTEVELMIAKSQNTIFTSQYTCDVFAANGVSTKYAPLAFDSYNFAVKPKRRVLQDRITFNVLGKYEKRKSHEKVIKAWIKRFGGNREYFLQCAVYNPFFPNAQETNQRITQELTGGKHVFNVNFFGHMLQNALYNDFLNSGDIVLGMSGGEGWGLPEFHSVALGKHAVIMNAHGYKGWATKDNCVLVEPNGKTEAYDGLFFQKGAPFNQGNIFTFDEDEFIHACEVAVEKVKSSNRVNEAGLSLQTEFSKERMVKSIIESL